MKKALAALAIVGLSLTASFGQTSQGHTGRAEVFVPDPTQEGTWDGTWAYTSMAMKMALWMRTHKGKTEIKLKYESGQRPVVFETDWSGDATYYTAEAAATFQMHLTKNDPGLIEGTWFWDTPTVTTNMVQKGTFSIFRALDGRVAVFKFNDFEEVVTKDGRGRRSEKPPVWTFLKVSKRQALWDELPF